MKTLKHFILPVIALIFIISCSNDDSNNSNSGENTDGNYFPSTVGSSWRYDVETTDNSTSETTNTEDNLEVLAETETTLILEANNGLPANGPIIGMLSSGTLTKSDTTLSLDGALDLPPEITDLIDFEITLNNFVLYKTTATNDEELATNGDTIIQDFNGFPLTINYELTSTALGFSNNQTINGTAYSNVVTSQLTLNLSASTIVEIAGFPITINVLEPQDFLVSTNYFVDGIGLVKADTSTSYEISSAAIAALEAAGISLPIPANGSTAIVQDLIEYTIAE